MNDFWWGVISGAVLGIVVFIGWFLCTYDVCWDMGDEE